MEYKKMRDKALTDAIESCRIAMRDAAGGEDPLESRLFEAVARIPAPGYFISFEYAYRLVGFWLREGEANPRGRRGQMIAEIAGKCAGQMAQYPGMSLVEALTRVLAFGRASSFFLSPMQIKKIYYRTRGMPRYLRRRHRKLF